MGSEIVQVKALAFDVGGSVFDWQSAVRKKVVELAAVHGTSIDDHAFAHAWRRRMFGMLAEVRHGERDHCNADQLHRAGLDELVPDYPGFDLTDSEKDELTMVWHAMDVWEDFPDALVRLRQRYKVVILSVLSYSILLDSSKHAGISWDGLLSCEFMHKYKPEPEAYQQGATLLGLAPAEVMMVAVHPGDLAAAARAGMKTGFVKPKVAEAGSEGDSSGFDIQAEDYTDFADQVCR
jgi:2-haloacid dehalogenase